MTDFRVRSAQERRQELRDHAAALGIDEAYISTLVDTFYTRVGAHPAALPREGPGPAVPFRDRAA